MDFEAIKELIGEPHRVTREEGEDMLFRDEIDPFTGRLTGHKYLDPMVRACWEQQGYDPDRVVEMYRRSKEAADPTIIEGTVVRKMLPEG